MLTCNRIKIDFRHLVKKNGDLLIFYSKSTLKNSRIFSILIRPFETSRVIENLSFSLMYHYDVGMTFKSIRHINKH